MSRYLSGWPGFGMTKRGEVWNGPIRSSSSFHVKGPMYLPFLTSAMTIPRTTFTNSTTVALFSGVCVLVMMGKSSQNPSLIPWGMHLYFSNIPASWRASSHASALYRVSTFDLLCSRAVDSSMRWLDTT